MFAYFYRTYINEVLKGTCLLISRLHSYFVIHQFQYNNQSLLLLCQQKSSLKPRYDQCDKYDQQPLSRVYELLYSSIKKKKQA